MPAAVYVPDETPYYRMIAGFWATIEEARDSKEAKEPGAVAVRGSVTQLRNRLSDGDITELTGLPVYR